MSKKCSMCNRRLSIDESIKLYSCTKCTLIETDKYKALFITLKPKNINIYIKYNFSQDETCFIFNNLQIDLKIKGNYFDKIDVHNVQNKLNTLLLYM